MKVEEIVVKYLHSDKCREGEYLPKEYYCITTGFFKLLESLENAEANIRLGTIEAEIISLCSLNADNQALQTYINDLRSLETSGFSLEKLRKCENLFKSMRDIYMEKYAKTVMLMEVG